MHSPPALGTILVAVRPAAADTAASRAAAQLATAARGQVVTLELADTGVPAVEVARCAECAHAQLIVLGREPHDVVEGAVRRARVPCLIVPPGQTTFGRILAAVDAGPDSREVLEAAFAVGKLMGGTVTALHVEQPALVAAGAARGSDRPAWAAPHGVRDVIVRQGDPVAQILRAVREEGFDLLVHGHHRGGPRNGHETGSIAARLLQRAPCAVLTVPI